MKFKKGNPLKHYYRIMSANAKQSYWTSITNIALIFFTFWLGIYVQDLVARRNSVYNSKLAKAEYLNTTYPIYEDVIKRNSTNNVLFRNIYDYKHNKFSVDIEAESLDIGDYSDSTNVFTYCDDIQSLVSDLYLFFPDKTKKKLIKNSKQYFLGDFVLRLSENSKTSIFGLLNQRKYYEITRQYSMIDLQSEAKQINPEEAMECIHQLKHISGSQDAYKKLLNTEFIKDYYLSPCIENLAIIEQELLFESREPFIRISFGPIIMLICCIIIFILNAFYLAHRIVDSDKNLD